MQKAKPFIFCLSLMVLLFTAGCNFSDSPTKAVDNKKDEPSPVVDPTWESSKHSATDQEILFLKNYLMSNYNYSESYIDSSLKNIMVGKKIFYELCGVYYMGGMNYIEPGGECDRIEYMSQIPKVSPYGEVDADNYTFDIYVNNELVGDFDVSIYNDEDIGVDDLPKVEIKLNREEAFKIAVDSPECDMGDNPSKGSAHIVNTDYGEGIGPHYEFVAAKVHCGIHHCIVDAVTGKVADFGVGLMCD